MQKNIEEITAKVDYEFSHRYNHTLHAYIDISEDLVAGTLLSQIMYWFSDDKSGNRKVKVYKEGYYWLAKGRNDWVNEIRISPKQYDNAIKKLRDKGLVETKLYKFNAVPTTHIRPVYEKINREIKAWKENLVKEISGFNQTSNSDLPKGENGILLNGKMDIDQTVNSITETTNNDYNAKDYSSETTNINASNSKELEDTINASFSEEKERVPYLDMNNCTSDEVKNHYAVRCKRFAKNHNITDPQKIDDTASTIEYFCRQYYETFNERHPVLSDRALERVFINFCFPPELLYEFGYTDFDAYKELIDRYFATEYGKYQLSGVAPDYSISHFMSERILTNLCKNVFSIPHV